MTQLEERMKLHVAGQVTWPEPELKRWCSQCPHFEQNTVSKKTAADGKGRCRMVKLHQKVQGNVFNGREAIACPQMLKELT